MPHEKGPGLAKCRRLGRSMLRALEYVSANPGCTKFQCARHIGAPRGKDPAHAPASMYWTIDRCAELGLLDATLRVGKGPRVYALTITPNGARELAERSEP